MELSRLMLKKIVFSQKKGFLKFSQNKAFLKFSQKKAFLIFLEMNPALFSPSSKNKKIQLQVNFVYFREWKPLKNFYFLKKSCSYISGNRKPGKTLHISE